MEQVKKNVQTFLEILQIAKGESVINWDESNFKRAHRWAQYAEEVHKKLENKPSRGQVLSNHIREIQMPNYDADDMAFTFNDLQDASQKLRLVLLHNPHLSSIQFSYVLDMYQVDFSAPSHKDFENLVMDTHSISDSKGTFLTLSSIKDQLSMEHSKVSSQVVRGAEDTCLDTCAKLLWKNFTDSIEKQKEGALSLDDGVMKKLQSLVLCSEKGMEIVLRMLVLPMKDKTPVNSLRGDGTVCDEIKIHILHWIVECSKHIGTESYEKLWSCPSDLLCEISAMSISFLGSYMCFLHSWGDSLLGIGSGQVDTGDQTSYGSCYRHIIEKFRTLMQGPEHVSDLCREKLKSWSVRSAGNLLNTNFEVSPNNEKLRANFWKKVYNELNL